MAVLICLGWKLGRPRARPKLRDRGHNNEIGETVSESTTNRGRYPLCKQLQRTPASILHS